MNDSTAFQPIFPTQTQGLCFHRQTYRNSAIVEMCISALGIILNGFAIFTIVMLKDYKKSTSHW